MSIPELLGEAAELLEEFSRGPKFGDLVDDLGGAIQEGAARCARARELAATLRGVAVEFAATPVMREDATVERIADFVDRQADAAARYLVSPDSVASLRAVATFIRDGAWKP